MSLLWLNSQIFTQLQFASVHLAVVGFVVVAAEVEQAVEDELFDLGFEREIVFGGLFGGLFGRDDYVAEEVYDEAKSYLAGEEMPKSAQRVLDIYVTSKYLRPQYVVPVFLTVFILVMYVLGRVMAAGVGGFVWGQFERGVKRLPDGLMTTDSVVMRASSGTVRWVKGEHRTARKDK